MDFCDIPSLPVKASISKKRKSSDTLNEPMQKLLFEVYSNQEIRTPLLKLQFKQLRHRLESLLTHIKSIATFEQVSPKTIASLSLKLIANEEKDYGTSEVCRQIVEEGTKIEQRLKLPSQRLKSGFEVHKAVSIPGNRHCSAKVVSLLEEHTSRGVSHRSLSYRKVYLGETENTKCAWLPRACIT